MHAVIAPGDDEFERKSYNENGKTRRRPRSQKQAFGRFPNLNNDGKQISMAP